MIPDFEAWLQNKPLPPGTKIRLSTYHSVWWNGLESTIVAWDDKRPRLYKIAPIRQPDGRIEEYCHRDNFVVIEP